MPLYSIIPKDSYLASSIESKIFFATLDLGFKVAWVFLSWYLNFSAILSAIPLISFFSNSSSLIQAMEESQS